MRMSQKEREQLQAEFAILSSLKHPNIVGYYHREHLRTSQDLHLYMEYCGNGDLGKVIKDLQAKNKYAEEGFVWSIFAQLVTALYRCHYGVDPPEVGSNVMGLGNTAKPQKPAGGVMILHRDLKPENSKLSRCMYCCCANHVSLSWRRKLGQTWRFWSLEIDAITRFRFDIRRNTFLHVSGDLRRRTIHIEIRHLVVGLYHV